jgi:hypothetical protein
MRLIRRLPMLTWIMLSETSIRCSWSRTNESPLGLGYRMPKSLGWGSTAMPFLITNRGHIFCTKPRLPKAWISTMTRLAALHCQNDAE